jgi:mycobactin polyketide synthetase MbtC
MNDSPSDLCPADADPVVIVGMAVEAPGEIDTAEGYWSLLSQGHEA